MNKTNALQNKKNGQAFIKKRFQQKKYSECNKMIYFLLKILINNQFWG